MNYTLSYLSKIVTKILIIKTIKKFKKKFNKIILNNINCEKDGNRSKI